MKLKGPHRDLSQSQDETTLSSLMRLAQNGDAKSYSTLLKRIGELMTDFVQNSFRRLGLNSSMGTEDVVQEILLAIHSKRATYDPNQYFLPWLYAIGRYKFVDYLRRNGTQQRLNVSIDDELENLEDLATHSIADGIDVEALCDTLPPKQRDLLKMVKIEGLSVNEVSARTGFSQSDVKVSVHRALKALQQKIKRSTDEN